MTTGDMWSPILSCFGTTWSSDASSGSPHSVKMEATNSERKQWRQCLFFFAQVLKVLVNKKRDKNKTFVWLLFFSLCKKKTNQQSLSWLRFAWGCDRAGRDFMGRCPMIHWVIGFRPVLIAGGPEPKKSWRIPESSFLHHSAEWNLVCKCLTSFEASFTVLGALIQTTWRPASGYGPV